MRREPATIVVLAWNEWSATRACLDSLRPTLGVHDQVVVVDNGSTDQTPRGLKKYPWIEIVTNEVNRGFAGGCNDGAAVARNDVLVFLNNDTLPVGHWLDALLEPFADETVGATGSRSNFVSGPQLIPDVGYRTARRSDVSRFERQWRQSHQGETTEVNRLVGFCLAVRHASFATIGGFDEGFGLGGFEDDDLCTRLRAAGSRLLIAHGSFVHHDGHKTFDANDLDWYALQQENEQRYRAKHHTDADLTPGVVRAPLLAASLIVRNEEQRLEACLASVADHVDEIVVYDTGSTDRTIEIARDAGAVVIEGYWDDDFARARNAALDACSAKWILQIDADEELVVQGDVRRQLSGLDALVVEIDNVDGRGEVAFTHSAARLFRRERGLFAGALHEEIGPRSGQEKLRYGVCRSVRLRHWGYVNGEFDSKGKGERNLRVARFAVQNTEGLDGKALVGLARSLVSAGQLHEAVQRFEQALRLPMPAITQRLALRSGATVLADLGRYADADRWLARLRESVVDPSVVDYLGAKVLAMRGDYAAAADRLAAVDDVRDGDGYSLPRSAVLVQRGKFFADADRWYDAYGCFVEALRLNASPAPWALGAIACSKAGADGRDLALLVDEDELVEVLGSLLSAPVDASDVVFEALWQRYPCSAPLLAGAVRLAPQLEVERALEWSTRLRSAGLDRSCPLSALARDPKRGAADRVQAAAVVAALFDSTEGERLVVDAAPAVSGAEFVAVLVMLSELCPELLPAFVSALASDPGRSLDVGRVLRDFGAPDEAAAVFVRGLELADPTEPALDDRTIDELETALRDRVGPESEAVVIELGGDRSTALAGELERNRDQFERLEAEVEELVVRRQDELAARTAQAAAHFAWTTHTGRFASQRIERAMAKVARRLSRVGTSPVRNDGEPERVLHVVTQAHAIGGHTRLVWRWMTYDTERHHELVLTQHGDSPIPEELVEACNGRVHVLGQDGQSLLDRAGDLRSIAESADTVVLHSHPFDVVPLLALTPRPAPVILLNHAGHVFWLGGSVGDVVANLRASTRHLAATRRGLESDRLAELPSPLDPVPQPRESRQAKVQLGIDEEAKVLLTIASPYKYAQTGDVGFLDLVLPVLEVHPEAVLVVVGPSHEGAWAEAARRTGGRVRAFGYREDLQPFHEAADLYLDSYPLPSTTSLLEAAAFGTPVVSFAPEGSAAGPLSVDDFALGELLQRVETVQDHTALVSALIFDDERRAELGRLSAAAVADGHSGAGWQARVNEVYDQLRRMPPADLAPLEVPAGYVPELDGALLLLHARGGQTSTVEQLLQTHGAVADMEAWQP